MATSAAFVAAAGSALLDLDDGEALVEGDRDVVAVGVGHVRLVGGAVIVGLHSLDGSTRHSLERRCRHLVGHLAREHLLGTGGSVCLVLRRSVVESSVVGPSSIVGGRRGRVGLFDERSRPPTMPTPVAAVPMAALATPAPPASTATMAAAVTARRRNLEGFVLVMLLPLVTATDVAWLGLT